jgi:hypothetical protein
VTREDLEREANHVREGLIMLQLCLGDYDKIDDADRVALTLAHEGLDALIAEIERILDNPPKPSQ